MVPFSLDSNVRLLGAFINQTQGLSPKHIAERDAAILVEDARTANDTLESAITAEI